MVGADLRTNAVDLSINTPLDEDLITLEHQQAVDRFLG
jgi:hypothetical protein